MRSLIERCGGIATVAPSMREIPLDRNPAAFEFADRLLRGEIPVVVFLTGVGARALVEVLEVKHPRAELFPALAGATVVVRGPKPTAVLREWGVRIDHRAPEPNTWRELLGVLEQNVPLAGRTIAVQEYGEPSRELYDGLAARGATVLPVPVYRWELPEDLEPLKQAIAATIAGAFDGLLFTSAQQVRHVLTVAERDGRRDAWLDAARNCLVASIGPTCSEALDDAGLRVSVEASPPRMGQLVKGAIDALTG